jgi:signal transduction histidine kinase
VGLLAAWSVLNIAPLLPSTQALVAPLLRRGGGLLVLAFLLGFVAVQAYRYRRVSNETQRQQTRWVVLGITAALGGYGLFRVAPWPAAYAAIYKDLVYVTLAMLCLLAIPLSIGMAMLRSRLWDLDVVVNRALVYAALTVSTIGLYALVVGYFSTLFQAEAGPVIAFVATGLVAVLFEPLRARLQRGVNRMMYGERDDPASVLARLSQRLEATVAPARALPTIVETVAQALRLPYAAITLDTPEGAPQVAAESGQPGREVISLPLTYQSRPVGHLLLAPRSKGEALSSADRHLLGIITQQAGVLAHNARLGDALRRLNADLQASRERLVTAQEEERRRLRRDLHDSVGPTLASLLQRLDTAADLVKEAPEASVAMLHDLKGQVKSTLGEIRRLVYALRPPVLDEFGLVTALREHVAPYHAPGGLRVTVRAPEPLPALPAAVEVAAYRIALEAFTNCARHAQAQSCEIALMLEAEALVVEVSDDGVGMPPGVHWGVGLAAMRERAAELGGECIVGAAPGGGTRVRARLPLPGGAAAQGGAEA